MLPTANSLYPDGDWVFQQDSAPAHKEWLNTISVNEWPASSPDLNPMDYSIWGILEAKVNASPHRSLEWLKRKLVKEWDNLPMAIDAWRLRLGYVVKKHAGRLE